MPAHNPPAVPDLEHAADSLPLDGLFQRRDAAGKLVEEASFSAGHLHGPFRLFAPDGTIRRYAAYVDGLADGLVTDYDDAGQKLAETNWQAGQRHGEAWLYADGRLVQAMHWRHGRLDGPLRVFTPAGALSAVLPYREGRLHGIVQLYDPDGGLMLEAAHADGLRHGPSVRYAADGQANERVDYVEGRPKGAPTVVPENAPGEAADPLRAFYAGLAQERSTKVE